MAKLEWIHYPETATSLEMWVAELDKYQIRIEKVEFDRYSWITNRCGPDSKPQQVTTLDDAMNQSIHEVRSWCV